MTAIYNAVVTGSFSANTESLAIEITTPANQTIKIRKIRLTPTDGTDTTVNDFHRNLKIVTESVAGTGGSTFTPNPLDPNANASTTTTKIGPMSKGTVSTTIDSFSVHSGTDFYWSAVDEDDKIVITPGSIFGVVINPAA